MLVLVVLVGDRLPGYRAIDGPLIVELSDGRGVHAIDVVVVVVTAVLLGWVLARRVGARRRE
ncbi:MAG: hypothetical protein AAGA99_00025 [Actinomycetota bacterium]